VLNVRKIPTSFLAEPAQLAFQVFQVPSHLTAGRPVGRAPDRTRMSVSRIVRNADGPERQA
jgi:hypothetical protein